MRDVMKEYNMLLIKPEPILSGQLRIHFRSVGTMETSVTLDVKIGLESLNQTIEKYASKSMDDRTAYTIVYVWMKSGLSISLMRQGARVKYLVVHC